MDKKYKRPTVAEQYARHKHIIKTKIIPQARQWLRLYRRGGGNMIKVGEESGTSRPSVDKFIDDNKVYLTEQDLKIVAWVMKQATKEAENIHFVVKDRYAR